MSLEEHRKAIDAVDKKLVRLLNERTGHALAIGAIKLEAGEEIYAPHRERLIFQRLAKRADSDQQTTRELRHALAETAADRAACRFPAGVMQQLETARQRAAKATTGGLGSTVPDPGGGD